MEGNRTTELDAEENIWNKNGRRSNKDNGNCIIGRPYNFTLHK
jgi:hypothetical protein